MIPFNQYAQRRRICLASVFEPPVFRWSTGQSLGRGVPAVATPILVSGLLSVPMSLDSKSWGPSVHTSMAS